MITTTHRKFISAENGVINMRVLHLYCILQYPVNIILTKLFSYILLSQNYIYYLYTVHTYTYIPVEALIQCERNQTQQYCNWTAIARHKTYTSCTYCSNHRRQLDHTAKQTYTPFCRL